MSHIGNQTNPSLFSLGVQDFASGPHLPDRRCILQMICRPTSSPVTKSVSRCVALEWRQTNHTDADEAGSTQRESLQKNQRVTRWGIRRLEDLAWVLPDITVREIVVSYRHSRQLNDLAGRLAHLSSSGSAPAALPLHLEAEGVPPVCGYGLVTPEQIAAWLAHRIGEVEQLTDELPTIAVLVCEDQAVKPIAEALDRALADRNIRAVACPDGQARGQDNDVRVFDVQHIKGLEFEAVYFVGVDLLSTREPDLFEKYLYVGATRAAWRRERLAGVR